MDTALGTNPPDRESSPSGAKASPEGRALPVWRGRPLVGHLDAFGRNRAALLLRVLEKNEDAVEMPMGPLWRAVGITSPALANEVLVTKQKAFHKSPGLAIFLRPLLGDGLLTSETTAHERQRRLLAPAFAPKRIAGYGATMAERADRFSESLRDGEELDMAEAMMRLTFEIVGKTLFDAEVQGDAAAVGEAITTMMSIVTSQMNSLVPIPPMIPTPKNLRYKRAITRIDDLVYRIIRERRAQGEDRGDVLSMLLEAKDEDGTPMSDTQVRDEAMTLFLAGHETTAIALTWTFDLLARHPEVRAKMEAELDAALPSSATRVSLEDLKRLPYTLAVFKEAMRVYPPVYMISRRTMTDVQIGGFNVKKGSIVMLNIIGIHRRADLWPNPSAFDPERFLGDREKQLPRCAFMPFGAGSRICIGNHFALMEGHLLLATIARRARFQLRSDKPAELEPLVTLRPRGGLPVQVSLRAS